MKVIHMDRIKGWMRSYLLKRLEDAPLDFNNCFTELAMFQKFDQWSQQNLTADDVESLLAIKLHTSPEEFQQWAAGVFADGGVDLPYDFFEAYGHYNMKKLGEMGAVEKGIHNIRVSDEVDPQSMN